MSCKSVFTPLLLIGMLTLSGLVRADTHFWNQPEKPSHAILDRAFEGKVYRLLDEEIGSAARYVQVTRFGNTILLTGEVENSAHASVIDKLVLDAAGIKRETPAGSAVVPEKSRGCGGRPAMGNVKRRQIVKGGGDCSALRGDRPGEARGRLYNHLSVAASDPIRKIATANLLFAEAVVELVDAGFDQVLDRGAMRMVVQDGLLYILGSLHETERTRISTVLMAFPGVSDVRFYTE